MGLLLTIAKIALRQIKIPVKTLQELIELGDLDGDGYIDLGEVIALALATKKTIREKEP